MNLDISPDTFMRFLHGNDGLGVAEPLGLVFLPCFFFFLFFFLLSSPFFLF